MINLDIRLKRLGAISLLVAATTSCSMTPSTEFYSLSTQPPATERPGKILFPSGLGIGPIRFPDTLKRPQLVTRNSDNELNIAEYDHWGGMLDEQFAMTLEKNLIDRVQAPQIQSFPWNNHRRPPIQVPMTVYQFDGELNKSVKLSAAWEYIEYDTDKVLGRASIDLTEPVSGGYAGIAAGLSKAIATMSEQIRGDLANLATRMQDSAEK